MRRTSDRSNTLCACGGGSAENADTRSIRIELRTALRQNRAMTGDAGQAAKLCGTKPLGIEPRPRAKFTLATKSFGRLRGCGVVDGISSLQIATNAETLQQRDQLIDRLMAQLPNPPAAAGTIAIRQFREFEVRFLQQKRRARCGAAPPDNRGFQDCRGDARGRKGVRDQGSGHPATHNSDGGVVLTRQHRISLFGSCGVRKPQRPSDAQPSLRRAQRRHSDDGSDNQASSRSSGQQLTILSTGIPARRACANAVSA